MGHAFRPASGLAAGLGALACTGLVAACSKRAAPAVATARSSASAASTSVPLASAATHSSAGSTSASPGSAPAVSARPITTSVVAEKTDAGIPGLAPGELFDIGPAGPATATAEGVVMITKDDRVLVAKRVAGRPDKAHFENVDAEATFSALGRGPGVAGGHAYWVSSGRLVRQALAGSSPLQVLADDARPGSRVTAVEIDGKVGVAFLGRPDDEGTSHARLWLNGKFFDLTPDGAGASSVALTRAGDHLLATAIDGRSAMTPMHARTVRVDAAGAELGADTVVWVGGPAQAWTETFVGSEAGRAWAQVPIERDITHFGLASVDLGPEPHMDSDVAFFDYPNGIDLAPVAPAELCGRAHVAFVRPTTRAPRSPQELALARLGTSESVTLANARGFASVSLGPVPGGAVLAYVADGRTWARGLACR